jgi:exonuclease III
MAFRKKANHILQYKPDIIVVPECEHPNKITYSAHLAKPTGVLWFGTNQHKGLGVFAYNKYKLTLLDVHNPDFKIIAPIAVTGHGYNITLFAIWANNPGDADGQYVEQIWKAIHYYENILNNKQVILTGDFNSNSIWDRKRRAGNHTNVVKFLEAKGVVSAYHCQHKLQHGREQHPTFYFYRHKDKFYHLDYCFLSADLMKKMQSVEIGEYDFWATHSDHVPVIVTLKGRKGSIV